MITSVIHHLTRLDVISLFEEANDFLEVILIIYYETE